MAYAMYEWNADFLGSSKMAMVMINRLTKPVCQNVLRKEPTGYLSMEDVDELAQNFLVLKALTAFAQHGTIPRVTYIEDTDEQPMIEGELITLVENAEQTDTFVSSAKF